MLLLRSQEAPRSWAHISPAPTVSGLNGPPLPLGGCDVHQALALALPQRPGPAGQDGPRIPAAPALLVSS